MNVRKFVSSFATLAAALLLASPGARAQAAPDWNYVSWVEVCLNDRAAVMSVMEQWTPFHKKHVTEYIPFEVYTGDDGKMHFVNFLKDPNDVERGGKLFEKAVEKYTSLGLPDLGPKWYGGAASTDSSLWKLDRDLSYLPEGSGAAMQSQPFRKVIVFHLKNDRIQAWKEAVKSLNEADKKAGLTTARFVFEAKVGADLPAFSFVVPALDTADYYTGLVKRTEKRGGKEVGEKIVKGLQDASRTVQNYHLTLHRDLSRSPE